MIFKVIMLIKDLISYIIIIIIFNTTIDFVAVDYFYYFNCTFYRFIKIV